LGDELFTVLPGYIQERLKPSVRVDTDVLEGFEQYFFPIMNYLTFEKCGPLNYCYVLLNFVALIILLRWHFIKMGDIARASLVDNVFNCFLENNTFASNNGIAHPILELTFDRMDFMGMRKIYSGNVFSQMVINSDEDPLPQYVVDFIASIDKPQTPLIQDAIKRRIVTKQPFKTK
jgi:hypothetical protein